MSETKLGCYEINHGNGQTTIYRRGEHRDRLIWHGNFFVSNGVADAGIAPAIVLMHSEDMLELVQRVANLNPNAGEIGEGMLRQLVGDAREIEQSMETHYENLK